MTPEQLRKSMTYDPDPWDPDRTPGPLPAHGKTERRLAVVFALLAGLAIGAAIAWGLQ